MSVHKATEGWWWLSFVDPDRPEGQRSLGVSVVRGTDVITASEEAWERGCNPGGEVAGWPLPDPEPPEEMRNKLFSRAEIDAFREKYA